MTELDIRSHYYYIVWTNNFRNQASNLTVFIFMFCQTTFCLFTADVTEVITLISPVFEKTIKIISKKINSAFQNMK